MEGKRNRLKRKPKVLPVPSKECNSTLPKKQKDGHGEDTDVIVIDEESPIAPAVAVSTANTSDNQCAEEVSKQEGSLTTLVEALLALRKCRRRLPLQTLPDLPAYQPPPEVTKVDNTQADIPAGIQTELPPLPKICPCRLPRRKRQRPRSGLQDICALQEECGTTSRHTKHASASPSGKTGATKKDPQQAEKSCSHPLPNPDQGKTSSQREHRVPVASQEKDGPHPVGYRPAISKSGLFSKFSTVSNTCDDIDEFEETTLTKAFQERHGDRKLSVQKRPSKYLDTCSDSKKIKSSGTSVTDIKQTSVTKSLFSSQAKPLVSTSKSNPGKKSQQLISSFSTKWSAQTKVSMKDSAEGSALGNTSISVSRGSQQSKFFDTALSSKVTSTSVTSAPGPSREVVHEKASSLPETGLAPKPLQKPEEIKGTGFGAGQNTERGGGKRHKEEGKGSAGSSAPVGQHERVGSCPLCQQTFSTAMQQLDIDAHIAACLSVADDDDIVW